MESQQPNYITALRPDDVLFGRGPNIVRYRGNISFRKIVHDLKPAYIETSRHHIKDEIARQVVETVKAKGGRFLRRVESLKELEELGVPDEVQAWVLVDDETVLQKVKQTFRDDDKSISVAKDKHTHVSNAAKSTLSGSSALAIPKKQKLQQGQLTEQHMPNHLQIQSPLIRSSNLLLRPNITQQQLTTERLLETMAIGQESQSLIQRLHHERQQQSQMALLASLLQPQTSTRVASVPLTMQAFSSPSRSSDIISMLLQPQSQESVRNQALMDYQTLLARTHQNPNEIAIHALLGAQNDPRQSLIPHISNNPSLSVDALRSRLIGQNNERAMEQLLAARTQLRSSSTHRMQPFNDSSQGLGSISLQTSTLGIQHPGNPLMYVGRAASNNLTALNEVARESTVSDNYLSSRGYSLGDYISTIMSQRNKREREDEMKNASSPPDEVVTVKKSKNDSA